MKPWGRSITIFIEIHFALYFSREHKLSNIPQYTSIMQKEQMSYLLTQQLSRIWLGNPGEVERTRWKQEWFKEGMATYFGYYFLSQVRIALKPIPKDIKRLTSD